MFEISFILFLIAGFFLIMKIENDRKTMQIERATDEEGKPIFLNPGAPLSFMFINFFFIFLMLGIYSMQITVQNLVYPSSNSITTVQISQQGYTSLQNPISYAMWGVVIFYILYDFLYIIVVYLNYARMKDYSSRF